jgi:acyl-CoA synthetase (AMP-forming)/AMP-acid ligase II
MVKKHSNEQIYLVAYLSAVKEAPFEKESLLKTLSQKFPSYMIPSALVVLEKMPLNANGKVDRFSLPEPEPSDFQTFSGKDSPNWMENFLGR